MSNTTTTTTTTTTTSILNSFLDAEKSYIDSLQMIDSRLSPLWMKQLESVAPDFSELLMCIQAILAVHKPFYDKLTSTTEFDLGDILNQLIASIRLPYLAFSEHYINNINQRQDIICAPLIQQFLDQEKEITLESLFSAPLQQIHLYKFLFNKPYIHIDQSILVQANQLFNSVMTKNALPPVNLDPFFHTKINCNSVVVDIVNDQPIENYQLSKLDKTVLCDTFHCTELAKRVQLVLTLNHLVFCCPENSNVLFPPIDINQVVVKAIHIDRELLGEYHVQLWINQHRHFSLTAKSKQERNTWLGLDSTASVKMSDAVAVSWIPLLQIVEKYDINRAPAPAAPAAPATISLKSRDFFSFYSEHNGEISPLGSSDEEDEDEDEEDDDDDLLDEKTEDKTNTCSFSSTCIAPAPPPKDTKIPIIVSGVNSLPVRNQSLKKYSPIPPTMLSSDVAAKTPDTPFLPVRPPHVRSLSSQPQKPRMEASTSTPPSATPSASSSSSSSAASKKPSFMRSVMAAMSLRHSKQNLKPSIDSVLPLSSPPSLKGPPSMSKSTVSLGQHTLKQPRDPALLRCYSAGNLSTNQPQQQQQQPPMPPQHLTIPPQSPFSHPQRSSFTSSQCSLALTPPLSRSSSPGSTTPVGGGFSSKYQTPSSSSSEDLGSPPESPDILLHHGNTIKSILYTNHQSQVFHWKDESWYAVQEECSVEVRQTFSHRSCVAIHMKKTGQLYLNAWVLPDTLICRTTETDLSLSLHISNHHESELENYLIHCESKSEADRLTSILQQMHQESVKMNMVISATSTLRGAPPVLLRASSNTNNTFILTQEELEKTFKLAMQCKCKLFVQSASSKWSSFGSVHMKVSQQHTTKKMHIAMESHKGSGKVTRLVSAMVQSRNVERLSPKRISFLMVDELEKNSVVYMIQVREEATGDKILEYIKTKNCENGW